MLPRQAFDSLKRHKGLYAIISTVILNAFVAIVYLIALRISLTFVVLPGGVSAVWLPSGITLALVCRFDYRVFPGIVVGSLVGLANLSWENAPVWGLTVVQVACAAGNCLQPYSAAQFLKYQGLSLLNPQTIFAQVRSAWLFALAAIVSPIVVGGQCVGPFDFYAPPALSPIVFGSQTPRGGPGYLCNFFFITVDYFLSARTPQLYLTAHLDVDCVSTRGFNLQYRRGDCG